MINNYLWCFCSGIKYLSEPGIFSPQVSSSKVGLYGFFLEVAVSIAKKTCKIKPKIIKTVLPIILPTFFSLALSMILFLEGFYGYCRKFI